MSVTSPKIIRQILGTIIAMTVAACHSGGVNQVALHSSAKTAVVKLNSANAEINNEVSLNYMLMLSQEGKRPVVNINGQPYYQSTGMNSATPGVVYPFLGLTVKQKNGKKNREAGVWIIKPGKGGRAWGVENIYANWINAIEGDDAKAAFVQILNEAAQTQNYASWGEALVADPDFRNFMGRLYSLDDARVSYSFGSGIWGEADAPYYVRALAEYFGQVEMVDFTYRLNSEPSAYINLDNLYNEDSKEQTKRNLASANEDIYNFISQI